MDYVSKTIHCEFCGVEIFREEEGVFIKDYEPRKFLVRDGLGHGKPQALSPRIEHLCSQLHITLTMPGLEPFGIDARVTPDELALPNDVFIQRYVEPALEQMKREYEARK